MRSITPISEFMAVWEPLRASAGRIRARLAPWIVVPVAVFSIAGAPSIASATVERGVGRAAASRQAHTVSFSARVLRSSRQGILIRRRLDRKHIWLPAADIAAMPRGRGGPAKLPMRRGDGATRPRPARDGTRRALVMSALLPGTQIVVTQHLS